jgi:HK97 family phage major capsid protein
MQLRGAHASRLKRDVNPAVLGRRRRGGFLSILSVVAAFFTIAAMEGEGGGSPTSTLAKSVAHIREDRNAHLAVIEDIVALATEEKRDLTEDEKTRKQAAMDAIAELDERIAELGELEERNRKSEEYFASLEKGAEDRASRPGSGIRVGREELVYREKGEHNFLKDAYRAQFAQDPKAKERIDRHQEQMETEYRDVGTAAFTGLVVPQYLIDLYAPKARAGRPLADAIRNLPLPEDGMTLNISRLTTGSAVAAQATENAAVQETDVDDTLLTVNVRTYAGQQDVSRQALDRGTQVDAIVVADLVADYHTKLDQALISADGTGGTHLGLLSTAGTNSITYTDATPTVAELWPKIADAIGQVNSALFAGVDLMVMHPRRWAWVTAALDSGGRPIIGFEGMGPTNALGFNQTPGDITRRVGNLQGVVVLIDGNVPTNLGAGTNEDAIIILDSQQAILWEQGDTPMQMRFEETNSGNLSVKIVVFDYSAFTAGRNPAAVSKITGTGLIAPTF